MENIVEISQSKLRELQLVQLEIFDLIDKICKDNHIEYTLGWGSMLGAIRHKAFIPWDDDLDIAMTRENYNRFIRAWHDNPKDGYFLQTYMNEPEYTQSFCKVRKNNTLFLGHDEVDKNYHHGIFVDIFPYDKIANKRMSLLTHKYVACVYLLLLRRYVPKNNGNIISFVCSLILKFIPKQNYKKICLKCEKYLSKSPKSDDYSYICYCNYDALKDIMKKEIFEQYDDYSFEGRKVRGTACYDEYLKMLYGDYMTLPPLDKRRGSHKIVKLEI